MFRMFALAALAFLAGSTAFAQSSSNASSGPMIFDVRRSLPLEPNEPVYKDFYINAGPESGLKKGVFISVVRPLPIHDPIQNKQQATLNVPVGHLQVLHVERGITVARLQDELTDDERPTLEFEGVMVGDRVDLGSMTTTAPKRPSDKKKSGGLFGATAQQAQPTTAAAVPVPAAPAVEVKLESNSAAVALQGAQALNATDSSSVAPAPAEAPARAPDTAQPVTPSIQPTKTAAAQPQSA